MLRNPGYQRLILQETRTRRQQRVRWPNDYRFLLSAAVRPGGRQIALRFFNSAIVDRLSDLWLLDVASRRLTHVPGWPLAADPKHTSLAWTPDGRLVMLTTIKRGDALIVWRPGWRRPQSAYLQLPLAKGLYATRTAGPDALAAW